MIIARFEKYHETDVMTTNETEEGYDSILVYSGKGRSRKVGTKEP